MILFQKFSMQVAFNTDLSVALAMVTTAFSIGVVLALCAFGCLHRLLQTGGILREAAEASAAMPSLIFLLPLVIYSDRTSHNAPCAHLHDWCPQMRSVGSLMVIRCVQLLLVLLFLLFGYWLLIALLLASAGEPMHGHMRYDRRLQWFFVYHTIGLLWSAEVILHLGFCVASGAVVSPPHLFATSFLGTTVCAVEQARWYFASPETLPPNRGADAIRNLIINTLRFSPGSLALGALLLIPGRVFRFFLEHCLHQAQTDGHGTLGPELRRFAKCCMHCCLDCSTRCTACTACALSRRTSRCTVHAH